jgi:hypothetical protein
MRSDIPIRYFDSDGTLHYCRLGAVRLLFPGHGDEDLRREKILKLKAVAEDILEEYGIDLLELLSWPGKTQQEYFLIGHSNQYTHNQSLEKLNENETTEEPASDSERDASSTYDDPAITAYADGGDSAVGNDDNSHEADSAIDPDQPVSSGNDGRNDTRPQRIKTLVDEHFDGEIGTQICSIDLSQLGTMPIPTSRLLQSTNISIGSIETTQQVGAVELVRKLNEDRIPFVFQSLLEPAASSKSHDYLITSRLAPFGVDHGIVTESDLKAHLNRDNQYRISEYIPGPSSDNWALPVDTHRRYANQQGTYPSKINQLDEMGLRDGSTEELAVGYPEYRALLEGRVHNDDRYKELFGAYGRIPIHKNDLLHFFAAVPEYFDVNSFGRLPTTAQPEFTTEELGATTPGTNQSYGLEEPGDTATVTDDSDEESPPHKKLVNKRIEFLVRHGHEIVAVDQDVIDTEVPGTDPTTTQYLEGDSRPDIVSKKEGITYFHEAEVENKTKPAALIMNLARAVYHDHPLHVFTETQREAESKLWTTNPETKDGPVSMPFKDSDDEGTILYTQRKTVSQDAEDVWYLLPRDQTEATWRLTPDDTLQLLGPDGSILATGDAEASVDTFDFNTPRVYKNGGEWILESASGEVLRQRDTRRGAASGYTFIRKPLVPTRFEYLNETTVEFQSQDGFSIFEKPPQWEMPQQNASIRYEEATKEFVELVTIESEGAELSIPELRRRFKPWYRTQTDLKEPNETWFGRALRAHFEVDDSDDHNKKLVGRTFRFSEGLLSPDLSFFDKEGE